MRQVMIRTPWTQFNFRVKSFTRKQQAFCCWLIYGVLLMILSFNPTIGSAQQTAPAPTAPSQPTIAGATQSPAEKQDSPDENTKSVNNPFTPEGVNSSKQMMSRAEVEKLLAEQEVRLKKEFNGGMSVDEISKMIANATVSSAASNPDSFIGCVNGVPLYRVDDGTLNLGAHEPDEIKAQRCGK